MAGQLINAQAGPDAGCQQLCFRLSDHCGWHGDRLTGLPAMLLEETGDAADGIVDAATEVDALVTVEIDGIEIGRASCRERV